MMATVFTVAVAKALGVPYMRTDRIPAGHMIAAKMSESGLILLHEYRPRNWNGGPRRFRSAHGVGVECFGTSLRSRSLGR